ncbi:MAG: DUF1570 domain-containing protein [Planctomycetota bacterium]
MLRLMSFSYSVFFKAGAYLCLYQFLATGLLPFNSSSCVAGEKSRLVELKDQTTTWLGKLEAKDSSYCYLIDQYGEMAHLPISSLTSFRVVADSFKPASQADFRRRLLKEFSASGYEVQASAHYVVVGKRGRARAFATLFEEIYLQVLDFYHVRGFEVEAPDSPLVAIVFESQDEFKEYCGRDEMLWSKDLKGYYSGRTNRVALFDDPQLLKEVAGTESPSVTRSSSPNRILSSAVPAAMRNSVAGETFNTIVHETTHQVGFNIGIHPRLGQTPMWVVEGLATVLEAPGIRTKGKAKDSKTRINAGRRDWFQTEYSQRHQPGDLAKLISSDDMFSSQTFDAYSFAWAFSYFLTENPARARLFTRYLKKLSERDPMVNYTAEERLRDFRAVFGDISKMEVEFIRSMDRLESK